MKVLHLNTYDIKGGAARAVSRLNHGINNLETEFVSEILVVNKEGNESSVIGPKTNFKKWLNLTRPTLDALPLYLYKKKNNKDGFYFSPAWLNYRIEKEIKKVDPDIIHIHWINEGFLTPESIKRFNRPLVWTFHDCWPFTGGCHVVSNCEKYKFKCGECPLLESHNINDLSRSLWRRKWKSFNNLDMTVIAPSKWMFDNIKKSSLFKEKKIELISHGVNIKRFKPVQKETSREILNLPQDKNIVLFGAVDPTNLNKGFSLLQSSLNHLESLGVLNFEIAVFGSSRPELKQNIHYLNYLNDDYSLSLAYSAADITIVPSIQESFGQVACESLACGTPVAAFNASGLKDIIDHKVNGYLAKPYDSTDLAVGINWLLNYGDRDSLSRNAVNKVREKFDLEKQALKVVSIYNRVLGKTGDQNI